MSQEQMRESQEHLHVKQECDTSLQGMERVTARTELTADVAVMRSLGVIKWRDIELGPEPVQSDGTRTTQRSFTAQEREQQEREERRRVASASSGGPVKRVGDS